MIMKRSEFLNIISGKDVSRFSTSWVNLDLTKDRDGYRRIYVFDNISPINHPIGLGIVWSYEKTVKSLKSITSRFNFGCDFEDGLCIKIRNRINETRNLLLAAQSQKLMTKGEKRCCCSNCGACIGFLRIIFKSDIDTYADNFSRKNGFWKDGVGCSLPRKLRSSICLIHRCAYLVDICTIRNTAIDNELYALGKAIRLFEDKLVSFTN